MSNLPALVKPDPDPVLTQFNCLIDELLSGNLNRSKFQPWEIEIIVDMVDCELPRASGCIAMLREYQKAVQQRTREGALVLLKLSEYLESQGKSSRHVRRAHATSGHAIA